MSTATLETAVGEWPVDSKTYHGDTDWHGHSMLEYFRESAAGFCNVYVTGTEPRKEATPEMKQGTALHTLFLEPDKFDAEIAIEPNCDGRTKEGKATKAEFRANCNGKTIIAADQYECVKLMAKAIAAHKQVKSLFGRGGVREMGYRANCPNTGLPLKVRPDFLCVDDLIADIKSSRDSSPAGWSRYAASAGYNRQAAHYIQVVELATGRRCKFVHIVADSSNPLRPAACYLMSEKWIELGRLQNLRTKTRLKECYESNNWMEPQNESILVIDPPKWAEYLE